MLQIDQKMNIIFVSCFFLRNEVVLISCELLNAAVILLIKIIRIEQFITNKEYNIIYYIIFCFFFVFCYCALLCFLKIQKQKNFKPL